MPGSGWAKAKPADDAARRAPMEYRLSDLTLAPPGLDRLRHGLASKSLLRFARRVAEVGTEVAIAALLDRLRPLAGELRQVAEGRAPIGRGSIALYLHWSPTGAVSEMVLRQLDAWTEASFDVVFVSNATPPPGDWEKLATRSMLRMTRDNVGRDFGGWRDALPVAIERFGVPRELLLANDSVLGPIRPMAPVLGALRGGGEGLFGMTESRGGGAHLQSYLLLARGAGAVADIAAHLAACRPTRSKWRLVQQGEIGLTRRMLEAGHRVAALFGYDRITASLTPAERAAFGPRFAEPEALARFPLNPTHHLWRVLVERFGFPYLKTELLLRNPNRVPGIEDWPALTDPATRALIAAHLVQIRAGIGGVG